MRRGLISMSWFLTFSNFSSLLTVTLTNGMPSCSRARSKNNVLLLISFITNSTQTTIFSFLLASLNCSHACGSLDNSKKFSGGGLFCRVTPWANPEAKALANIKSKKDSWAMVSCKIGLQKVRIVMHVKQNQGLQFSLWVITQMHACMEIWPNLLITLSIQLLCPIQKVLLLKHAQICPLSFLFRQGSFTAFPTRLRALCLRVLYGCQHLQKIINNTLPTMSYALLILPFTVWAIIQCHVLCHHYCIIIFIGATLSELQINGKAVRELYLYVHMHPSWEIYSRH